MAKYGTLDVAFEYDSGEQWLAVTVTAATDIPALKQTGNISWQVHMVLLPTKKQRAKTGVQKGPCPVFTETFKFLRVEQDSLGDYAVRFRLYSIRRMKKEKVLGEKVFQLTKLNLHGKMALPVTLEPGSEATGCGSVVSVSRSGGALSYRSTEDSLPELLLGLVYNSTTGRLSAEVIQGSHFKTSATEKPIGERGGERGEREGGRGESGREREEGGGRARGGEGREVIQSDPGQPLPPIGENGRGERGEWEGGERGGERRGGRAERGGLSVLPLSPDPRPLSPDPGPLSPDPGPLSPDPRPLSPDPGPLSPDPRPLSPDPGPLSPDPGPLSPDPRPLSPDPGPLSPDPGPLSPDPGPLSPDPRPLSPDPGPLSPDPRPLSPDPGPLSPDPRPLNGLFCCVKHVVGGQLYIMRDTYVKLVMLDSKGKQMSKCRTGVCRGQPSPTYRESFVFQVSLFQLSEVSLVLSVFWRRSSLRPRERLGGVCLGLNSTSEEQSSHWNQMREAEGQQDQEEEEDQEEDQEEDLEEEEEDQNQWMDQDQEKEEDLEEENQDQEED
uniref:C2 domain-containing protein n=1 Tax=Knipowitschia caucasica TaxID=637954 RepID=A0AAV2KFT3_KNICA